MLNACCERILEHWSLSIAASMLATSFPLRERPDIQEFWQQLMERIAKDKDHVKLIVESLLMKFVTSNRTK